MLVHSLKAQRLKPLGLATSGARRLQSSSPGNAPPQKPRAPIGPAHVAASALGLEPGAPTLQSSSQGASTKLAKAAAQSQARPKSSHPPSKFVQKPQSSHKSSPPKHTLESHAKPSTLAPMTSDSDVSIPMQGTASSSPESEAALQPQRPKSWLTRQVEASPAALKLFLAVAKALGYGSPKQIAGRRSFAMYSQICAVKADDEADFWRNECHLPPTFQSWFTITNLHVWLLTVRLRSLPQPHGRAYIQGLVDHFFLDIEDRVRAVLQPPATPSEPYTFHTPFYINPNAPPPAPADGTKPPPRVRAPDRLVTRQMKIFKEQWAGLGLACDLGLVKGDAELAGAVWRNLLGARGARGIAFPQPATTAPPPPAFRRAVNLVGGEVVNVAKIDLEKEETRDDGSGVHDFGPMEANKYLKFPEVMLDLVGYARRELVRLEAISDEQIINGDLSVLRFGKVREEEEPTRHVKVKK